jgi:hypothetical protein
MSNKYKDGEKVPDGVLADRLEELAQAVVDQNMSEFVMRVPAELDYCPDLVMSAAAKRLREIQTEEANG